MKIPKPVGVKRVEREGEVAHVCHRERMRRTGMRRRNRIVKDSTLGVFEIRTVVRLARGVPLN